MSISTSCKGVLSDTDADEFGAQWRKMPDGNQVRFYSRKCVSTAESAFLQQKVRFYSRKCVSTAESAFNIFCFPVYVVLISSIVHRRKIFQVHERLCSSGGVFVLALDVATSWGS